MLQEIRLESFFPADQTTVAHRWELVSQVW